MASTSDIRNGLCIRYSHDIFKMIEFLTRETWKRASVCKNQNEKCHQWKSDRQHLFSRTQN